LLITQIWRVAVAPAVKSPQSILVRSVFEPTAATFTPMAIIRPEEPILPSVGKVRESGKVIRT
jgi:hypothetical protein